MAESPARRFPRANPLRTPQRERNRMALVAAGAPEAFVAEHDESHGKQTLPDKMTSLMASALRLTGKNAKTAVRKTTQGGWQEEVWEMLDLVGEYRFLVTTLATTLSQARLYAGKLPEDATETPEVLSTGPAVTALEAFGDNPQSRSNMIARLALNLYATGDGYLAGIPKNIEEILENRKSGKSNPRLRIAPTDEKKASEVDLKDLEWAAYSIDEIKLSGDDDLTIRKSAATEDDITATLDDVAVIRVWSPHPRYGWQATSPSRAVLPVLRELVGLTMATSAQIDSRLAGAGIFIVPQSARDAVVQGSALEDSDDPEYDPFTDPLIEAMMTAIRERENASAKVPLILVVPDETTDMFKHITFATPLDKEAKNLRDEAIRRLALGMDAPPEVLLGVGGMNHWGAWLVREDIITTHIEPPLALICDAITKQYLWPLLESQGMSEEEAHSHVIWYDVDHLILRPNLVENAFKLHELELITDDSLRDAAGFADADSPDKEIDPPQVTDFAIQRAIELASENPALFKEPGLLQLAQDLRDLYKGEKPPEPEPMVEGQTPEGAPAEKNPEDPKPEVGPPDKANLPVVAASAALAEPPTRVESEIAQQLTITVEQLRDIVARQEARQDLTASMKLEVPEGAFQLRMPEQRTPDVTVNVQPTPMTVVNDVQPTPVRIENNIEVEPTPITVDNHVEPTPITVEAPQVTVESPTVNVEPAAVTVEAAQVTVEPTINVPKADVNVTVEQPKPRRRRSKVIRNDKGQISEVETTE